MATVSGSAPTVEGHDLRTHPLWAPVHGSLHVGDWTISLWEEPRLPGDIGQDTTLVASLGATLRLAVVDAAENKTQPNSDRTALRATHTARTHLRIATTLDAALSAAAAEMCDPQLRPTQRNPMATLAAVDLDRTTGDAYALRCGDSEVWARTDDGWANVFPSDMLTAEARATWTAARQASPNATAEQQWAEQERLLDDPGAWLCRPLGLDPVPAPQRTHLAGVEEIIVATDGARLTRDACARLGRWLAADIQIFSPGPRRHPSPHGDIAVLHATRTPRPTPQLDVDSYDGAPNPHCDTAYCPDTLPHTH